MCYCLARQVRFKNKTKIYKCLSVLVLSVSIISCSKDRSRAKGNSVNYLDKPNCIKYMLFSVLLEQSC